MKVKEVSLGEVKFDSGVYPRKEHDQALAQRYAESMAEIEAAGQWMSVSNDLTLLDGRHRMIAYELNASGAKDRRVKVKVYEECVSEGDKLELAAKLNSEHGWQLSVSDKKRTAVNLYSRFNKSQKEIAAALSVSLSKVSEWLSVILESEREARRERIREKYLRCYTEDEIAQAEQSSQPVVAREISDFYSEITTGKKRIEVTFSESGWSDPVYNVWAFAKKTNEVDHFGNTEQRIVDNLLFLYTKPLEIVIDPFGGGGSTLEVCCKRKRRCWLSDRKPKAGLEDRMRTLDICLELPGLSKRWSEVALVYLDPPYWRQARHQYSKDAADLANMELEEFTGQMVGIIKRFAAKMCHGFIAMMMQPTQYNSEPKGRFTDHVFDIVEGVGSKKVMVENRVSCPYSTEQCTPQMVEWAKANKKLLVLSRELVIWKVEHNDTAKE
jgi:hypothetical protein